ncbi:MAG: RNA-binding protein [Desulfurococcus sp.]|nr:RNA-binding protein [Desulfurococcus sp.]
MACSIVLIATCRVGSVEWCIREIGDVLYALDSNVVVEEAGFPGVLFVRSCLSVERVYRRAISSEYGFVENIIPVHGSASLEDFLRDPGVILRNLVYPGRVKIKIRMRGVRGLSRILFARVAEVLRSMGVTHDPSSPTCLFIEGVGGVVYLGVGLCKSVRRSLV